MSDTPDPCHTSYLTTRLALVTAAMAQLEGMIRVWTYKRDFMNSAIIGYNLDLIRLGYNFETRVAPSSPAMTILFQELLPHIEWCRHGREFFNRKCIRDYDMFRKLREDKMNLEEQIAEHNAYYALQREG